MSTKVIVLLLLIFYRPLVKEIWLTEGLELLVPLTIQDSDTQLRIGALNTVANVCNHDDDDLKVFYRV